MGSPEDWGALGDVGEIPDTQTSTLGEALTAHMSARLFGFPVRAHVESVSAIHGKHRQPDRLILTNLTTGNRVILAPCGPDSRIALAAPCDPSSSARLHLSLPGAGPQAKLAGGSCCGRLLEVSGRRSGIPGGSDTLALRFENRACGPFLDWVPRLRRTLRKLLPDAIADEVATFLPEVWVMPTGEEIVVRMEETAQDGQPWQVMMWWPLLLEDWVLLNEKTGKVQEASNDAASVTMSRSATVLASFAPSEMRLQEQA